MLGIYPSHGRSFGLCLFSLRSTLVFLLLNAVVALHAGNYVDIVITSGPYNADPTGSNDASDAFRSALNAVKTAGGGYIHVPAGTYKFNSKVTVDNSGPWWVMIEGAGQNNSILAANNSSGVIHLKTSANWPNVTIRDIGFRADVDSGVAFQLQLLNVPGAQFKRHMTARNIRVWGKTGSTSFKFGLIADRAYRTLFQNVTIEGENSIRSGSRGIRVDSNYAPVIADSYIDNYDVGVQCANMDDMEDFSLYGSTLFNCNTGLNLWADAGQEPQAQVIDNTFECNVKGIVMNNRKAFQIAENKMKLGPSASSGYRDIQVQSIGFTNSGPAATTWGVIMNNIFSESLSGTRHNVWLNKATYINITNNDLNGAITKNDSASTFRSTNNY